MTKENIRNMREIKFRAWDKRNKIMVGGASGGISFGGKVLVRWNGNLLYCEIGNEKYTNFPEDNFILMQYTGLKDKNGDEIYEGDILSDIVEVEKEILEFIYKVEWADDIGPGWVGVPPRGRCFLKEMNMSLYEVIGNIYENPDLIT